MFKKPFGDKWRFLRTEAGMTLVEVSKLLGISVVKTSQFEREVAVPTEEQIKILLSHINKKEFEIEMFQYAKKVIPMTENFQWND